MCYAIICSGQFTGLGFRMICHLRMLNGKPSGMRDTFTSTADEVTSGKEIPKKCQRFFFF